MMKIKMTLLTLVAATAVSSGLEASSCCCCSLGSESEAPRKLTKQEEAALKAQGGVVYEEYGTAWHPIRYRTEFTAAQWKTILLQKRVRVPLTADDQRALSKLFVGE
jgi:hypothetical protein